MTNDQLASRIYENGKQIAASVTIQRRAADISLAWDGLVGLPGFVQCIRSADHPSRLTLVLSASSDDPEGQVASFEAEILRSEPERMVAWRSATDAPIVHAGSVTPVNYPSLAELRSGS